MEASAYLLHPSWNTTDSRGMMLSSIGLKLWIGVYSVGEKAASEYLSSAFISMCLQLLLIQAPNKVFKLARQGCITFYTP